MKKLLEIFFDLLYHPLAPTYDLVAATVSLGRWNDWVRSTVIYVQGKTLLELGHGPGHLQKALQPLLPVVIGLDESFWMSRIAKARLKRAGLQSRLVRGDARHLPVAPASIDVVVATFPTEYILSPLTVGEIHRVLTPGGRLVILASAWLTGRSPIERFLAWLFRFTGEVDEFIETTSERFTAPFMEAGIVMKTEILEIENSKLLLIIGHKETPAPR